MGGGADSAQAATIGYEAELWRMADALRRSMDAVEYEHVVGLISQRYTPYGPAESRAWVEDELALVSAPDVPPPELQRVAVRGALGQSKGTGRTIQSRLSRRTPMAGSRARSQIQACRR